MQTSYGVVPIGWVQSALTVLDDAPNQREADASSTLQPGCFEQVSARIKFSSTALISTTT